MKTIEQKIDNYFQLVKEIHDYFGYEEDWVVIPLDDTRDYWWCLHQDENGRGHVDFGESKETVINSDGNQYQHEIYTQRFLPKYVYRAEKFTLISCDTHTDGNKFLCIFDNSKEILKSN